LIWQRMGDNAALVPTAEQRKRLPRFLRDLAALPKALKPSAEECYQKSIELAPRLLDAHEGLFQYLLKNGEDKRAVKAGGGPRGRSPDHTETLQDLARLHIENERYADARAALERALRHNPLDRPLRHRLGYVHLLLGRECVEKGQLDEARKHYPASIAYTEPD